MAITKHLQHPKSSATTTTTQGVTVPRLPSSGDLLYGEIAVNYRDGFETLSIRNSSNDIVPFPTNNHSINVSAGSAIVPGQIAMDGDVFYIFNEQTGEWQPVATNHVTDESELDSIPAVQSPQFAYVTSTGLVYVSQYNQGAQTWVPIATLDATTKTLAVSQQPKIMVDYFTSDQLPPQALENVLVFDASDNKLKQYGEMVNQGGVMDLELLYEFDPSLNLIYYNKNTDKSYRWTGTAMAEILKRLTIETDTALNAVTGDGSVTISSNIFSANTNLGTVLYKMTPNGSANTASNASGSILLGLANSITDASGSTMAGRGNTISGGDDSFVEGRGNAIYGSAAHAEGASTVASGNYSHVEGHSTTANGDASHAEGSGTTASSSGSHAEGGATVASGEFSHAEGEETTANGYSSHAEGGGTQANGGCSHAEGDTTIASGDMSHAEGIETQANGNCSHAEGGGTQANGDASHAEGEDTQAGGRASHAEGGGTQANGHCSHAEGISSVASGDASCAAGSGTVANNSAEFACGTYNVSQTGQNASDQTLFSVGFGTSSSPQNAIEIRKDGKVYIYDLHGGVVCLQDILGL